MTVTAEKAAKFLTQATFGPSEAAIDNLVSQNNLEAWIDQQIALPMSRTLPYVEANSNGSLRSTRHDIWWKNAIEGDDQLRQRMAFALSEIFVISDLDYALGNAQYGVSHYYDMLAENAFGNYRELLEKVTLHPTMGIYLSMVRNQKANPALQIRPDENYAREVLQLFSVGLYKLNDRGEALPLANPIPTYSQNTVEDFAKVFTGWNFADSSGTWVSNDLTPYDKRLAMVADYNTPVADSYHDTTTKVLLNGAQLMSSASSATPAEDDMEAALDNIASHPNVAPFFSKLLIQRFTTSNPSPNYVERVAAVFNDNGQGEKGDLGAVVKAILLDQEAVNGKSVNPDFGKVKEPLMQLAQLWRAFDAQPGSGAINNSYRLYAKSSDRLEEVFGQAVLKSPSVFNFFLPDNLLASDSSLYAPEMQIMTEANVASMHNAFHQQIYTLNSQDTGGWDGATRINIDKAVQLAPDVDALIEYLNKLLLAGSLGASQKSIITNHLATISDSSERAQEAIFLIVASAGFQVQG
ncbi:DUF1800 domain-containing protein [Cocleimonas sp. KMM 6895]|uniref:DUF1800 domain-containing protein n=1 Tax=Cocleimonas sp. KMM 6895 TaxID=2993581 RepID=UPI002DD6696E|nr:DUF1800 family protein [Cocleimonas sp. KMM 6895]